MVVSIAFGFASKARDLAAMIAAEHLVDERGLFALTVQLGAGAAAFPVDDARFPDVVEHVTQKFVRILLSPGLKMSGQLLKTGEDPLRSYDTVRIGEGISHVLRQFAGHAQAHHSTVAVQMIFVRVQQIVHQRRTVGERLEHRVHETSVAQIHAAGTDAFGLRVDREREGGRKSLIRIGLGQKF